MGVCTCGCVHIWVCAYVESVKDRRGEREEGETMLRGQDEEISIIHRGGKERGERRGGQIEGGMRT